MKYGYFDDQQREYVINRPDTPLPWINYLGSEAYFGLISNTGGGYSFYRDARLRRLTRYRYNNVPGDSGGRYIYLRDEANGVFWSPTWQPTCTTLEDYSCRHGLGYTIIQSAHQGIEAATRYFVPLGENLEVWELTLTNYRHQPASLSVFASVEFCLWDAWDDCTNFQRNFSTGQVELVDGVIYHKTEYRERRNHFAYFASSEKPFAFDTQREAFLGPYRGWNAPQAVENGQCSNSIANGWSPVGVQQVKVTLAPHESRRVIFLLGYHENPQDDKFDPPGSQTINKRTVQPVIARYTTPRLVDAAFEALRSYWSGLLERYQVQSPDPHTNRMVNIWNAYQCMITFIMSRS
ncbi:MAG: glycosyl transferase, partial [Chloroflexi bacterium]|nr:glycosyl transferase [Chloroflexota bacterium]